jgi:hypothetical protein
MLMHYIKDIFYAPGVQDGGVDNSSKNVNEQWLSTAPMDLADELRDKDFGMNYQ